MNLLPFKEVTPLIGETIRNWHRDRAPRMGAALAYYITLSLAPTVVIVLAVAGLAFGAKAAQGRSGVANSRTGRARRCQGDPVFD